ncbi:MAG: TraX family protein [bacterium]|nr:TraX family protein [bacterium]
MSSTILKLIALALMLTDHIAEFIPGTSIVLHYIGRLSYPVFLICVLWSLHYTHDRIQYFKRLYLVGVAMAVMNIILNNVIASPYVYISNNIMIPLLLTGVIIHIIELFQNARKEGWKWLMAFLLLQVISIAFCILSRETFGQMGVWGTTSFIAAVLPNVIWCEGSFFFIVMGVTLYFMKESKWKLSVTYILFSAFFILQSAPGFTYESLMWHHYQWMQVFALPFMLAYNGKRGPKMKYFFYIFYPVHIAVLYLIGNLCF